MDADPDGQMIEVQLPQVNRQSCIGCGICEYKCPVSGDAAIRVYLRNLMQETALHAALKDYLCPTWAQLKKFWWMAIGLMLLMVNF